MSARPTEIGMIEEGRTGTETICFHNLIHFNVWARGDGSKNETDVQTPREAAMTAAMGLPFVSSNDELKSSSATSSRWRRRREQTSSSPERGRLPPSADEDGSLWRLAGGYQWWPYDGYCSSERGEPNTLGVALAAAIFHNNCPSRPRTAIIAPIEPKGVAP